MHFRLAAVPLAFGILTTLLANPVPFVIPDPVGIHGKAANGPVEDLGKRIPNPVGIH